MKLITDAREAWLQYYANAVAAQRRVVEEDARRLGGRITWEDLQ